MLNVLNVEKNKNGGMSRTHKKSLEIIKNYCESLDLVDVWRVLNPELFKFTWRQRKPEVYCRLDFFLVSQGILCKIHVIEADIISGYKTDHSMIILEISLHSNTRGRGFWKLNTSFIETE